MQRNDRVSNVVLVTLMICATIIILAFRDRPTKYVMQRTDGEAVDDHAPITFPQEVPLRKERRA
jgi:hypothetical protein